MSILHNTDKLFDEKYQSLKEKLQDAHHELYLKQDELDDTYMIEDESDRSNEEDAIVSAIEDKERQLEESESAINEHKEFVEYFDTMLKEQADNKAYMLSLKESS